VNGAVERFEDRAAFGRTVVYEDELLRHSVSARLLHWSVAAFFILALLSGFAIYSPWLYRWLTPPFGGGAMTRLLHPWFSLGFVLLFAAQIVNWRRPMVWTGADRRWLRDVMAYITNTESRERDDVDFFNAGQKLYFWAIAGSAAIFVLSGIPLWFPLTFGRAIVSISYVLHDVAALAMLVGFIIHLYESTISQPGTLRSMTRGTVKRRWAWTLHPAWYKRATGRDPAVDYEAAVRAQRGGALDGDLFSR
jgi:formate dehydrogenase subunit gamma